MDTYTHHGLRALVCCLALMTPVVALGQRQNFVRGDVDGNRVIDISDPIGVFSYAFLGTFTPTCLKSVDANDDGRIDIGDGIWLLAFSYRGSSPPPAPFPDCGVDPTADGLECSLPVGYAPVLCECSKNQVKRR